ncbi:hypothetical protein CDAR_88971 [Caerostris darwini]|uniref:Uncharacterized protein n=1 Tax=Caerostris darwini TaxID=1538125 RepID=A0AAV4UZ92_9ARAC|nr:hypothetical protein CDAR_88971 [Caerostris darwini]
MSTCKNEPVEQKDCPVLFNRYFQPDSIRMHKRTTGNVSPPPPLPTEVDFTSPSNLSAGGESLGECFSLPILLPDVPARIPSGTPRIAGHGRRVSLFAAGETEL